MILEDSMGQNDGIANFDVIDPCSNEAIHCCLRIRPTAVGNYVSDNCHVNGTFLSVLDVRPP